MLCCCAAFKWPAVNGCSKNWRLSYSMVLFCFKLNVKVFWCVLRGAVVLDSVSLSFEEVALPACALLERRFTKKQIFFKHFKFKKTTCTYYCWQALPWAAAWLHFVCHNYCFQYYHGPHLYAWSVYQLMMDALDCENQNDLLPLAMLKRRCAAQLHYLCLLCSALLFPFFQSEQYWANLKGITNQLCSVNTKNYN